VAAGRSGQGGLERMRADSGVLRATSGAPR
jgi:hypothetical protein